jgi:hypothetical protein
VDSDGGTEGRARALREAGRFGGASVDLKR